MGMASASVTNDVVKLCLFDLRRGQNEGQELDKILFFYPADLPFSTQLSVIGLSEGLITFTRIFSPEAACEVIEAEMHSHVFYEAEPDIWMVLVVEKNKESEAIWRIDALRRFLKEVHCLFVMFHGSIRALLDKEPAGGLIRTHLYYFIMDYLSDFLIAKKLQLPNFRESLKERGTMQILTMGREAALEVQSLVKVLESCAGSIPCYSLIMFQDLLVSSTLSPFIRRDLNIVGHSLAKFAIELSRETVWEVSFPMWLSSAAQDDTVNLHTYAGLRLSPRVLSSGVSTWSYLRKGSVAHSASYGPSLRNPDSILNQSNGSREISHLGDHSYDVIRPLNVDKWSRGKDGFLVADHWGTAADISAHNIPTIWLRQTEDRMYLCAYQHKSLTLIILIPVTSLPSEEQGISLMRQQIIDNASLKIIKVEEKLSSGWGGENAYHVPGYRYLLVDGDRFISRASPPGKVTTLMKDSLVALNKLREEVDLEKSRATWDLVVHEKDMEVCIRAKNNAWVIARTTRGKELYMVLEKANETLLYASDAVEKFSDRYCNGAFSLG